MTKRVQLYELNRLLLLKEEERLVFLNLPFFQLLINSYVSFFPVATNGQATLNYYAKSGLTPKWIPTSYFIVIQCQLVCI